MSKWVRFSDRKPEEGQKIVIVTHGDFGVIEFDLKEFESDLEYWEPGYWHPFEVEEKDQ